MTLLIALLIIYWAQMPWWMWVAAIWLWVLKQFLIGWGRLEH